MGCSLGVFLVYLNDSLHFVIAAHEDPRSIMDMLGNDSKHALHPAVDCLSSSCNNISAWLR